MPTKRLKHREDLYLVHSVKPKAEMQDVVLMAPGQPGMILGFSLN